MINVVVGSSAGDEFELTYSISDQIIQSGPFKFNLNKVSPNPFNPITKIDFTLSEDNFVEVSIFNILGKKIDIIFNDYKVRGSYSINWDASKHASGIYYIQLKQGQNIESTKAILMK